LGSGEFAFLRLVQAVYALGVVTTLSTLMMTSRDAVVYDFVTILEWITVILQGVTVWFVLSQYKLARQMVMLTSATGIASRLVAFMDGGVSPFAMLLSCTWHLFLFLYFWRSEWLGLVLVNDFSTLELRPGGEDVRIERSGWPFLRNLVILFVSFSVFGHWLEAGMCQFIRLGLAQGDYGLTNTMMWRDWLYPYPMEGMMAVIVVLSLHPFWRMLLDRLRRAPIAAYLISFVANALTCTVVELLMGLAVNANHQLWDYSEIFGNFMGQVCLQNALAFGVMASLFTWMLYPLLERTAARIPSDVMDVIFVVVAVSGSMLWSLYIIDLPQSHVLLSVREIAATAESQMWELAQRQGEFGKDVLAAYVGR
jgi:hypothetical protein